MQRGNRDIKKFSVAGAQNAGRKWQEMEKHRQWLVLNGLEVIFRSLECISRGKLLLHPDQRRVNNQEVLQCQKRFTGGLDRVVTVGDI